MAIALSPSVTVREVDLTNVIPAVSTSVGGAVVDAVWGPVSEVVTVKSENELVQLFGRPNATNATSWFSAANFLAYSNNLLTVRTDTTNQRNAVSSLTKSITSIPVATGGAGYTGTVTVSIPAPTDAGGIQATATATVVGGVLTAVVVTNGGSGYSSVPVCSIVGTNTTPATLGTVVTTSAGVKINNRNAYDTSWANGQGIIGEWTAKYPGSLGNSFKVMMVDADGFATMDANVKGQFDGAPGTSSYAAARGITGDEMHIAIVDVDGRWSGLAGTVIEKFQYVSKLADAKKEDGTSAYYKQVINVNSNYIWWTDHTTAISSTGVALGVDTSTGTYSGAMVALTVPGSGTVTITTGATTVTGVNTSFTSADIGRKIYTAAGVYAGTILSVASATAATLTANGAAAIAGAAFAVSGAVTNQLVGGVDHLTSTNGQKMLAWDLFRNDEEFDVNLLVAGKADTALANYVISIADTRKDCIAFVSPQSTTTGDALIGNTSAITDDILLYRNAITSTSYAVIDSGYKNQYDKYNDQYRWVPLNGDIAGLCARTDNTDDPWFSPAGLNRGQIKNVVRLAFSPTRTDRDNLYKAGVNPVVSFPGQGVVLYGDKTALSKPSAFDRINVRRLFIVLEKAIATASKYQLFEFNDGFTRAQFVGMVTPFLRDVRGRRGVTDFLVVCDETNNTGEVIDTNRFVADIYIKPARSINFIQLNFIATRTGVAFSEIAGK